MPLSRSLSLVIEAPESELVPGFSIRRALPKRQRRTVGPFVFLDHMGPATIRKEHRLWVPPHPHIGLQTITYLFEGEILHKDSLGTVQVIRPGAANWMTAGEGIVHSEESTPEIEAAEGRLHGMQIWVTLPEDQRAIAPAFDHVGADDLPVVALDAGEARVIAGTWRGKAAAIKTHSEMLYLDLKLKAGAVELIDLPEEFEAAIYVATGRLSRPSHNDATPGTLWVFEAGKGCVLVAAQEDTRAILVGGPPFEEPTVIHWNFVGKDLETVQAAEADWKAGRFPGIPD